MHGQFYEPQKNNFPKPSHVQNRASFDRNRRTSAPKMRANDSKAHSKAAPMTHIICRTSKTSPACVPHSKRACWTHKLRKNRCKLVQFSSKIVCISRAKRTARSQNVCASISEDMHRLPAMIAHVVRSMRASHAPKSCRITRKIARVSIETGALRRKKCALTKSKHISKLQRW